LGSGAFSIGGKGGFKAADQSIEIGIGGSGSGRLIDTGATIDEATISLAIHGTIRTEAGIVELIPPLASIAWLPGVNTLNERVKVWAEIAPGMDLEFRFVGSAEGLVFLEAYLTPELAAKLGLTVKVYDSIKLEGWGGARILLAVKMERGAGTPHIEKIDGALFAGVNVNVYFWEYSKEEEWTVTWPEPQSSMAFALFSSEGFVSASPLSLFRRKYDNFGPYEQFLGDKSARQIQTLDSIGMAGAGAGKTAIVSNIYRAPAPQIIKLPNGKLLVVYVHDNVVLSQEQATGYLLDALEWNQLESAGPDP